MYRFWAAFFLVIAPIYPVSFNRDIAPLVYERCAPCHHPGGSGPFSLLTYQDVARHAAQIVAVTERRYMPPWPPEHGYGEFAGDRSLSSAQIHLFSEWLQQNKPEGNPADRPTPPTFNIGWQMGPPDLVLRMDKPFHLAAESEDVFRNFILPSGVSETRYIRGFELRLSNPRVVHHANVVLDRTQSLRKRDGQDGQPGFPGMDVITEAAANSFDPDSHFLFWKPASVLRLEPDDMAWRLDPATDLVLNLHLQSTGKEESLEVEIGLYFAKTAPTRFPMLVQLEHDGALRIPPGDRTFTISDSLTLPVDVDLLAVYPHAHYLGKTVEAWATLPNGTRRRLIRIPDWDINWQAVYDYQRPIALPRGTKLEMRISYDNSSANPRNPNHPPALVLTGNRSRDEMGHVWFQLLPKPVSPDSADPRLPIQEAVMRRRLEKYPGDYVAAYNLGALLQMQGKYAEAAAYFRAALKVEATSVTAHNSLATALLMQDEAPAAISELRKAIALDTTYTSAHYNLARALAASGDLDGSVSEYRTVLRQTPDDASAHAGLGTIQFKQRSYSEALANFREAARLNPKDADIQTNLGTLLAISGDSTDAVQAFEEALRLDPNQSAARANLQRLRSELAAKP